jgi:hypothetical protein
MPGRIAFVAERLSDDGKAEARFDAHWESEGGQEWSQGPRDVDIARALGWAREQADVVIVHTGEGKRYSAGTRPAEGVPERWPEGLSFEPRSIASRWVVLVRVSTGPAGDAETQRVVDALGRSPLVESVEVVSGAGGARVRGVVRGESAPEALKTIDGLVSPDLLEGGLEASPDIEVLGPA